MRAKLIRPRKGFKKFSGILKFLLCFPSILWAKCRVLIFNLVLLAEFWTLNIIGGGKIDLKIYHWFLQNTIVTHYCIYTYLLSKDILIVNKLCAIITILLSTGQTMIYIFCFLKIYWNFFMIECQIDFSV